MKKLLLGCIFIGILCLLSTFSEVTSVIRCDQLATWLPPDPSSVVQTVTWLPPDPSSPSA